MTTALVVKDDSMAQQSSHRQFSPQGTGALLLSRLRVRIARSRALTAALVALLFLYLRYFILPFAPTDQLADQLLFYSRGQHIVQGLTIYRDFFEMVTPGNDLLDAAVLKVFGLHAWIVPAGDVALGMALFLIVMVTAAKVLEGTSAQLPGLLFLACVFSAAEDITHHWYSTLCAQAAVYLLLCGRDTGRLIFAGILSALSVLFTQTQGAFVSVAIIAWLYWTCRGEVRLRQLAMFILPLSLLTGGVLGYCALWAGWRTLYFDLVIFPARFMSTDEHNTLRTYLHQFPAIHDSADILRAVPYVLVYALVPYVYLVGAYRLWKNRQTLSCELWQRLLLLHLAGFGLFLGVIAGPRFFRLCTVSPPAIILAVWLVNRPTPWATAARRLAYSVTALFLLLLAVHSQLMWHKILELPIGRVAFKDRGDAAEFEWMAAHTRPGDAFFNRTALAFYLELRTSPQVEVINDGEFTRPEQVDEVIAWMQQNLPLYVVLQPKDPSFRPEYAHSEPYRQYVQIHYRLVKIFPLNKGAQLEQVWELRKAVHPNMERAAIDGNSLVSKLNDGQ